MNESFHSVTDEDPLESLRSSVHEFSDSFHSALSTSDIDERIDAISNRVEELRRAADAAAKQKLIQNIGNVAMGTLNGIKKMESGDALGGTLDIITSVSIFTGEMVGGPFGAGVGAIIGTICSLTGAIFTAKNSHQPSFIEQVADVVHKELVEFNSKLQDQKYDGLKRRVSDQTAQLQKMKPGEKLDDPNLWNDYVQFMGELGNRIQSPITHKFEDNLTKDPDVVDFVRALTTYCKAYCCFNALLITAKGTFARLGKEYKGNDEEADRKTTSQRKDLEGKLSFLFEDRHLTFLGRLPSQGGKLTKIVAFSRNAEARRIVIMTTRGFGFPELLDYEAVESKAKIVSRQSVKLKLEGHPNIFAPGQEGMQFINETQYPMKVIGRTAPKGVKTKFTQILQPRSSAVVSRTVDSAGGYVIIYLDGKPSSDNESRDHSEDETRIIEFASYVRGSNARWGPPSGTNIQDKTCSEFTKGQDTYDKIDGEKKEIIYWTTKGVHFLASAELRSRKYPAEFGYVVEDHQWRFICQHFDPLWDTVTAPEG